MTAWHTVTPDGPAGRQMVTARVSYAARPAGSSYSTDRDSEKGREDSPPIRASALVFHGADFERQVRVRWTGHYSDGTPAPSDRLHGPTRPRDARVAAVASQTRTTARFPARVSQSAGARDRGGTARRPRSRGHPRWGGSTEWG